MFFLVFSIFKVGISLKYDSSIVFYPDKIYLVKGLKVDLHLYNGIIDKNNIIKPVEHIDLKSNDKQYFELKSNDPSLVNVSQEGIIEALQYGKTSIVARNRNKPSNIAHAIIHVVYPDSIKWENEQWIKPKYLKENDKSIGPFEPDLSNISLFYEGNKITLPQNYTITMKNNLYEVGTHIVEFTFAHINYSFNGIVHVCPPPRSKHECHYVYIGFKDYQFEIFGGSGLFDFSYNHSVLMIDENDSQIKIENHENVLICTVHPINEGKSVIQITDKKFNDYSVNVTIIYYSNQITPLPPPTQPYFRTFVPGTPSPSPTPSPTCTPSPSPTPTQPYFRTFVPGTPSPPPTPSPTCTPSPSPTPTRIYFRTFVPGTPSFKPDRSSNL